jgi:hypothetical protein
LHIFRDGGDGVHLLPSRAAQEDEVPTDISLIPDAVAADPDDTVPQADVLTEISRGTVDTSTFADFHAMRVHPLKLSKLRTFYERRDKNVLSLLAKRHEIKVDDEFRLKMGSGKIFMETKESMIDYHLTVASCVGFSPLLPNALSDHTFEFRMDLKKQIREFKGKHAMLGFDPAGRMLFIGTRDNEDVFLAMAPNEFLQGHIKASPHKKAKESSRMPRRHYRQTIMMLAHFLSELPNRSYWKLPVVGVFSQNLDADVPSFHSTTDAL